MSKTIHAEKLNQATSSTESQNLGKNEMKKHKTLTTTYEGNFQSEGPQFIGDQKFGDNTKIESIVFFRVKDHIDILTMF